MTQQYKFYISEPAPCPYIKGKEERKVIAYPKGEQTQNHFEMLAENGFRRSQNIAYRPMCENCEACQSTRIIVEKFETSQSMKRIWKKNNDIQANEVNNKPTKEQFNLFQKYLEARHNNNGMADMDFNDYAEMIGDSPVETRIIEFRIRDITKHTNENKLVAAVLFDRMENHLSMIYSFFDPKETKRSLGTFIIMHHINKTRKEGRQYCHLGYWVKNSKQMKYKDRYMPQERFINNEWEVIKK